MDAVVNARRAPAGATSLSTAPRAFHRALPGYAPTPLVPLPDVAATCGLDAVHVKDESRRLGLPAFKVLGASWAVARLVGGDDPPAALDALAAAARERGIERLVAATDGNHGRAVARIARLLGLRATILVPPAMVEARRAALRDEGADVVVEAGGYDAAVARAAAEAARDPGARCVNDADADGASPVPADVIEGYATLFLELDDQLEAPPDLLVLQAGVGAFAAAGTRWALARGVLPVVVEPARCACILPSLAAGRPVTIESAGTIMAGLDCPTPSVAAWPDLVAGLVGALAIPEEAADDAARRLHAAGVESGESGAAGLAGLIALATAPAAAALRDALRWGDVRTAAVVSTEGATDPERYAALVAG